MAQHWRRWRSVFQRNPNAELDEELRFHIEQRTRDYMARGMDADSARRAALERLGDLERVRGACTSLLAAERRSEARRWWLNLSWLDVKLGVRMLAKYPVLSLVSVVGMAVAIAIGAGYFAAIGAMLDTRLPFPDGDRIVGVRDPTRPLDHRQDLETVQDFLVWRDALKSVRDVSAFRTERRNLIRTAGRTELVNVAAITASGLQLTHVTPTLGRSLEPRNERPGAPPVIVIAYEEWQRRFDADPDILRRTIRLGQTQYTVVGVMPARFGFPIQHRYWVPLQLNAAEYAAGGGPPLTVFGRLAPGFTLAQANAELATMAERMAAAFPQTHAHLRPRLLPYTHALLNIEGPTMALALRALQLVVSLLLVIVSVNVAILVYARTITRSSEIAVRNALGASRRRVITQLFAEALVLSGISAALGLALTGTALAIFDSYVRRETDVAQPFWIHFGLSPGLILYVALLALLAGAIVGVVPALRATAGRVQPALQQLSSRASAMQLGRTWTAFIIVQLAVVVAALPCAANFAGASLQLGTVTPAAASNSMLNAVLAGAPPATAGATIPADGNAASVRQAAHSADLVRRLEAEPDVAGVALSRWFPGREAWTGIEVEGSTAQYTRINQVDLRLFDVFDVPVLVGRTFTPADARPAATAIVVNTVLAERIAGGANVLGRRVRLRHAAGDDTPPGPWLEIVGIVPDSGDRFAAANTFDGERPSLYQPLPPDPPLPLSLTIRTRGSSPAAFAGRLRDLTAAVDPELTLDRLQPVAQTFEHDQQAFGWLSLGIIAVMASVLLLSAAGVYALMSFTVGRRRREIGIRSALGADPRRLLTGVFARASAQLGAGILGGLLLTGVLDRIAGGGLMGGRALVLLPAVSALMLVVGLAAALGPARRGLAVQPTEALREE